jgi:hypothetical protein
MERTERSTWQPNSYLALKGSLILLAMFASTLIPRPADAQVLQCSSAPFQVAIAFTDPDVSYFWNETFLDVVRDTEGVGPGPIARSAAMMHGGIYDVMTNIHRAEQTENFPSGECYFEPYFYDGATPSGLNSGLVAGLVARDILLEEFPGQASIINSAFSVAPPVSFLGATPAEEDFAGVIVQSVLDARDDDGSDDDTPYSLDNVPGAWQPTGNMCESAGDAVTPNWGNVDPFVISSGSAFRPNGIYGSLTYTSILQHASYVTDFNEVKAFGSDSSSARSNDQEDAAWFWANDLDGTYKPPGQLLEHTQIVAQLQPLSTGNQGFLQDEYADVWLADGVRVSRLFARVSFALADAGIAARDAKFLTSTDLWRPETAIQQANSDGNPNTVQDATWRPLSADQNEEPFSPCFPAWISGHATFGGAWAGVMESEFSGDLLEPPVTSFNLTSDDPNAPSSPRFFDSFAAAATENAESRIWLGVHFRVDAEDGLEVGNAVGEQVAGVVAPFVIAAED